MQQATREAPAAVRHLEVHPLTCGLGAELAGVDLRRVDDPSVYAAIRAALNEHGVVFFRDQPLSDEQFIDFGRRFGQLQPSEALKPVAGEDPVLHVVKKETPTQNWVVGGGWHSDHSYCEEPVMGTILIARQVPDAGGDTMWIHAGKAYDALSDGLKRTLEHLWAVHRKSNGRGGRYTPEGEIPSAMGPLEDEEAWHPVVTRHPENGRKVLFINPTSTAQFRGWTREESEPLLHYLARHCQRPEFMCRFRWRRNSIAFWDNRQTWHYAVNDYGASERVMHRLMISGPKPIPAASTPL
jgi:taurine dioxygenase